MYIYSMSRMIGGKIHAVTCTDRNVGHSSPSVCTAHINTMRVWKDRFDNVTGLHCMIAARIACDPSHGFIVIDHRRVV